MAMLIKKKKKKAKNGEKIQRHETIKNAKLIEKHKKVATLR